MTFEAKKLPLPLWIPQKNRVATAYLSSANENLSRQNKAELGMQGGLGGSQQPVYKDGAHKIKLIRIMWVHLVLQVVILSKL